MTHPVEGEAEGEDPGDQHQHQRGHQPAEVAPVAPHLQRVVVAIADQDHELLLRRVSTQPDLMAEKGQQWHFLSRWLFVVTVDVCSMLPTCEFFLIVLRNKFKWILDNNNIINIV